MDTRDLPLKPSSGRQDVGARSTSTAPIALAALTALTALTTLGAALRFLRLDEQPLWLDEATSAAFSARPLLDCLFAEIHHPPLFSLILHVTTQLFGSTDFTLRLPSAIAGVAAIPVSWLVASRLLRDHGAARWWITALVASSPFLVALSQEARSYSIYFLLSLLCSWAFLRWRNKKSPGHLGALSLYVLLSIVLMYTHYFGIWILLVHEVVYWRWFRRRWRSWLVARALLVAAFLPWMLWVLSCLSNGSSLQARGWIGPIWIRIPYALITYCLGYGVAAANTARLQDPLWRIVIDEGPIVVPSLILFLSLAILGVRHVRRTSSELSTWIGSAFVLPTVFLAALSPWMRLFHERYLCFMAFFVCVLIGLGLNSCAARARLLASIGAAAVTIFALVAYFAPAGATTPFDLYTFRYGKEDWRGAAAFVDAADPDVVILAPGYLRLAYDRYARVGSPPRRRLLARAGTGTLPELGDAHRVALVLSHEGPAEERLLEALERRGRCRDVARFPWQSTIRVFIYDIVSNHEHSHRQNSAERE